MGWDGVPWFMSGGIKHTSNLARLLSYAAMGGREGVVSSGDLKVTQLAVPGGSVQMAPGAAAVLSRYQGVSQEMYIGRCPTADTIAIPATAATARTDLIIARVEDPYQQGSPWQAPTQAQIDAGTAVFIRTAIISNVGNLADDAAVDAKIASLGYSAIPLATVAMPAGTSTVVDAYITDRRRLPPAAQAAPKTLMKTVTMPSAGRLLNFAQNVWGDWPTDLAYDVVVPAWATHVQVLATLGGVQYGAKGTNGGNGWAVVGNLRVAFGATITGNSSGYDVGSDSGATRVTLLAALGKTPVPAALRGTTQTAKVQGQVTSSAPTTYLKADSGTTATIQVFFTQETE